MHRHVASTHETMQLQRRKTIESNSIASTKAGRISCISREDSNLDDLEVHAGMREQAGAETHADAQAAHSEASFPESVDPAGSPPRARSASNPGLVQQPGTRSAPDLGGVPNAVDAQQAAYQPAAAWAPVSGISAFSNADGAGATYDGQAVSHGARRSVSQRRQIFGMGAS